MEDAHLHLNRLHLHHHLHLQLFHSRPPRQQWTPVLEGLSRSSRSSSSRPHLAYWTLSSLSDRAVDWFLDVLLREETNVSKAPATNHHIFKYDYQNNIVGFKHCAVFDVLCAIVQITDNCCCNFKLFVQFNLCSINEPKQPQR